MSSLPKVDFHEGTVEKVRQRRSRCSEALTFSPVACGRATGPPGTPRPHLAACGLAGRPF